jgi:hypothetical protein
MASRTCWRSWYVPFFPPRSCTLIVSDEGLTVDEVTLHADRIRLWGEFNTAWLSIFQRQKDMLESGQRIQHPQTLITQDFINKMAKDLIRMCDAIEKHGLVDYQYGVAEEQIILGMLTPLCSTIYYHS